MKDNYTTTTDDIGFIFKKCDVPKACLAYWITVPEFSEEIKRIKGTNTTIDNALVFDIMKNIYKEKQDARERGIETDFKFQPARRGLRVLSELLTGNRDLWDK